MKKIVPPSVASLILMFFIIACESKPAYETCGGQLTCIPPIEDKASEAQKKLRADLAGKWKLAAVDTRDTFHKTGQTWTNQRYGLCISYDGGILLLQNYKEPICKYCYELKGESENVEMRVEETGLSAFCLESLKSSGVTFSGDSLILLRQDSFVVKKSIYRRMNDDGTFKVN